MIKTNDQKKFDRYNSYWKFTIYFFRYVIVNSQRFENQGTEFKFKFNEKLNYLEEKLPNSI